MSKTIKLRNRVKYNSQLASTNEIIKRFRLELYEQIVNLATLDKWSEWSDEKEIGSIIEIEDSLLRNLGDNNVNVLFELIDKIDELEEQITKG